ncbi:MAG TPA: T9SS type A sorting domain-containing protein, partial [Bacteroidia bacterium]|nr:T9SS type A sorting domain-containing protein [Bacteroidia bacterium]
DSSFIQISPYSGTELLCHPPNIHFNKIEAFFATVEIDLCFINFLECHYLIGFGNEIKELRCHSSINSQSLNNFGTSPNHFSKAFLEGSNITVSNYSFYIDTLFIDQVTNDLSFGQVDTIFILGELIVNKPTGQLIMHSSVNGMATDIFDASGTVCIKNVALRDIHVTGGAQFFAGSGCTDLGNNTGWQFASCSVISNVWPGDANYDLIVNNFDLLNIGIAFGETGSARAGASNNYVAQPSTDWSSYFISAVNKKHADCDGNGMVDDDDTLAVSLNYGLAHPARLAQNEQAISSGIELSFQFPTGAIAPGSPVNIPIFLGSSSVPADSIYGIAFTVNYDPSFINQGSMYADYSGSWIGNTGNSIHLEKDFSAIGKFEVAFTRTDHYGVSGFGLIGMLNFIVANNAIGLMYLSFSNVMAITNTGTEIPLLTNSGSIATGVENIQDTEQFSFLYPNPFHDRAEIVFSNPEYKKIILKVSDITGKEILYRQINGENKIIIERNNLSKGMFSYELKSEDEKTLSRGKFVVN